MGQPIAKKGDRVVGIDTHIVMISSPAGPIPTPLPNPFSGELKKDLSGNVFAEDKPVATVGSGADNQPAHIATGGSFQKSPSNKGTIKSGSDTVFANDKKIARDGDPVECCNDPTDSQTGHVVASGKCVAG